MPTRNLRNSNPSFERLRDDPPLLLRRPAPAAAYPGPNLHPPARQLCVAYSVGHMCETFPPNQREACDIPPASIKVGSEERLLKRRAQRRFFKMPRIAAFALVSGLCVLAEGYAYAQQA